MKHLLLLATLLISGATFAQDTVTLVLSRVQGLGFDDEPKPIFTRVEMTKEIFDLTNDRNSRRDLVCKYTKDDDLQLGHYYGALYARHKKFFNDEVMPCEFCGFNRFQDLFYKNARAVVQPLINDKRINYTIQSADSWQKVRDHRAGESMDLAHWKNIKLEDIPVTEVFSPSKHGENIPSKNGFYCFIWDYSLEDAIEPSKSR